MIESIVATDELEAYGHPNIRATHRSTLEITKDKSLTPRGDCILGVSATKSASELSEELKDSLRRGHLLVVILLVPGTELFDYFTAKGSPSLLFTDSRSLVIRKSDYIDGRTIAIHSSKAAKDIRRDLVEELKNTSARLRVIFATTSQHYPNETILEQIKHMIKSI